jgi:hypothetical protein
MSNCKIMKFSVTNIRKKYIYSQNNEINHSVLGRIDDSNFKKRSDLKKSIWIVNPRSKQDTIVEH